MSAVPRPFVLASRWHVLWLWPVRLWAAWRRRQGHYDRATLALWWWMARWRNTPAACQEWLLFRRDLGLPWPRRARYCLPDGQRGPVRQRHAALDADGALQARQARERDALQRAVRAACSQTGVCVVGNGAGLLGQGRGAQIDAHALVVRFNHWPRDAVADLGQRVDLWVCAPAVAIAPRGPGFEPPAAHWTVVSGPGWWSAASAGHLAVPLAVWRTLVKTLNAPPSAGVLTLAWLRELNGGWTGLQVTGIGRGPASAGRWHLARAGRRQGGRHDWGAEAALLSRWRREGLTELPPSGHGAWSA
ncbi:glycosyltransferase family 29 protein [Ideonella livida]|uniref:Uncharacterized protein n=1 Tax=Ideonella livida TaxID=2707176 RepID=A0A7C9PFV9_9BURK|nr:glycosyltransferase family 29 protein [Ideonella livida]NDY90897.1 hypothetical protein [Ideonella livida]